MIKIIPFDLKYDTNIISVENELQPSNTLSILSAEWTFWSAPAT